MRERGGGEKDEGRERERERNEDGGEDLFTEDKNPYIALNTHC